MVKVGMAMKANTVFGFTLAYLGCIMNGVLLSAVLFREGKHSPSRAGHRWEAGLYELERFLSESTKPSAANGPVPLLLAEM